MIVLAVQTTGLLSLAIVEHHYFPSFISKARFRALLLIYGTTLLSCIALLLSWL